jgi:alpha-ribazole phosphatase
MSEAILIRHGETEMAGRFCGQSDPDLNPAGELQAERAAEEVAQMGVGRIVSSDLLRAARTATAIGKRIGLPVEFRRDLREISFGLWEGLAWDEIERRFPEEAAAWMSEFPLRSAPEGESYAAFTARIDAAIGAILAEAEGRTTAIVSHRGVMNYALTKFFGCSEGEAFAKTAPYGAAIVAAQGREGEVR